MKIGFRRLLSIICPAVLAINAAGADVADRLDIYTSAQPGAVDIGRCSIYVDASDHTVVRKVADMLADDIRAVTGKHIDCRNSLSRDANGVIAIGTIGHSAVIDSLVAVHCVDVSEIAGGWERFVIRTVGGGADGGRPMVVIAGSDRRGTAYGVTTLCESIGVNPWVWWADVPADTKPELWVKADCVSQSPSVKYRGIFINDEDWGLQPWAAKNYEKELGDIGPRTYARVCELLLRLRGNMLAPAMHDCTGAFYSYPESKQVADDYGIIITTSHCEPMLFNNFAPSEWDKTRDGEWDYSTNRNTIFNKFDSRVAEAARYENIYTVAMRGVHDEAMGGKQSTEERVRLLEKVIADQRGILHDRLGRAPEEVPQIFVPYKETLDLYRSGLNVPDDVTIVWPDDNYGYMKCLSNQSEQRRPGGAGVYYHTSYLGTPHDYLWLCTTPPALMYHELSKAYRTGATRYWLLNVGDIKPAELAMQTFFEMAWDFDSFDSESVNTHQAGFLAGIFGRDREAEFQQLLDNYYRLAWSRKPEYMGWELEWDSHELEQLGPTDFSFGNYNDAQRRLADYRLMSDYVDSVAGRLPESLKAPFFELIGYPVLASDMMNRKFLMAQLNGELSQKGDKKGANNAARLSVEAADSIESLNRIFDTICGGKWRGMMSVPPGYCAKYHMMPSLTVYEGAGERPVDISVRSERDRHDGIHVVDLTTAVITPADSMSGVRLVPGIGYDWTSLCLGDAVGDSDCKHAPEARFDLPACECDSVTVHLYSLPFFPVHDGRGCKIGVSYDGQDEVVTEYLPEEWSAQWKTNVLRNSTEAVVRFPVDRTLSSHTLTVRSIDPGAVVQRIVLDYGGLKPTYVGPGLLN